MDPSARQAHAMKTAATLPPQDIVALVQLLGKEQVICQTRLACPESGLDTTDLLVGDADYERACDIIESWMEARGAEERRASTRHCPKCHSQSWEQVQDAHYEQAGLPVLRCKECGCLLPGMVPRASRFPLWWVIGVNVIAALLMVQFYWVPRGAEIRPMGPAYWGAMLVIAGLVGIPMVLPTLWRHRQLVWPWLVVVLSISPFPLMMLIFQSAQHFREFILEP
jgi:hypothetical protein